ncbi:MAG: hypothetical protein ACI8ZN_002203 [Bacteroidia bacterium]|jgi:hypothetical protein
MFCNPSIKEHKDGGGLVRDFKKGHQKKIHENHHDKIAKIRSDEIIMKIHGNDYFNHKKQNGCHEIARVKSQIFQHLIFYFLWVLVFHSVRIRYAMHRGQRSSEQNQNVSTRCIAAKDLPNKTKT